MAKRKGTYGGRWKGATLDQGGQAQVVLIQDLIQTRYAASPRVPVRTGLLMRSLGVPRSDAPCYSRSCRTAGALQQRENAGTPTSAQRSRANSGRVGGNENKFNGLHIMLHDVLMPLVGRPTRNEPFAEVR